MLLTTQKESLDSEGMRMVWMHVLDGAGLRKQPHGCQNPSQSSDPPPVVPIQHPWPWAVALGPWAQRKRYSFLYPLDRLYFPPYSISVTPHHLAPLILNGAGRSKGHLWFGAADLGIRRVFAVTAFTGRLYWHFKPLRISGLSYKCKRLKLKLWFMFSK